MNYLRNFINLISRKETTENPVSKFDKSHLF
jgi:hypothetical protein